MTRPETISRALLAASLALFAVVPMAGLHSDPNRYEGGRSRDHAARERRNSSAFAMMIGEFRTSMGDVLFVKTERYMDNGIAYEPHIEAEQMTREESVVGLEHLDTDEHDDEHPATLIRTAEEDFRGFIGDLHRAVKPWKDPKEGHVHTEGKELLPWLRVVTVTDPHYVRAYTSGGWWLKHYNTDEAEQFLLEGIRKNPGEFQIPYMLGQVYYRAGTNIDDTGTRADPRVIEYFLKARDQYYLAADTGIAKRPKDWIYTEEWSEEWTDYREEDLKASIQLGVLLDWRFGDLDSAIAHAERYLEALPDNPILLRNLAKMRLEKETGTREDQAMPRAIHDHDHDHEHDHDEHEAHEH